jgi:hypothetical protein
MQSEPLEHVLDEKSRLLELYKTAVLSHSAAINDLTVTRGRTSKQEYERIRTCAEKAKTDAEAAGREFFDHTQTHGC